MNQLRKITAALGLGFLFIPIFCLSAVAAALPGKIALVQYNADTHFNHYAENRANLTSYADAAVAQQANIIVFPEGSSYGYGNDNDVWCAASNTTPGCHDVAAIAETIPNGPSTLYWESYAHAHHVYLLFNLPEVDGEKYFNTSVIVSPEGYSAKYRKRDLFSTDTLYATAGDQPFTLNTPYGKFGVLICMDVTYPGNLENYRAAGVDATILMMDWDEDPNGDSAASRFIAERAQVAGVDIYSADVSLWDGSGKYSAWGGPRERNGLPASAIGVDGISFHTLAY